MQRWINEIYEIIIKEWYKLMIVNDLKQLKTDKSGEFIHTHSLMQK